jgi:hypothetical protein
MEAGLYVAGGVSIACLTVLFVMGNRLARIAIALFVFVTVGGFALFLAYASGLLAYVVDTVGTTA